MYCIYGQYVKLQDKNHKGSQILHTGPLCPILKSAIIRTTNTFTTGFCCCCCFVFLFCLPAKLSTQTTSGDSVIPYRPADEEQKRVSAGADCGVCSVSLGPTALGGDCRNARRFSAISVRCWTSSASFPLPPGLGAGRWLGWRKTESITRDGQRECVGEEQMGSKLLFN